MRTLHRAPEWTYVDREVMAEAEEELERERYELAHPGRIGDPDEEELQVEGESLNGELWK